MLMILSPAKTIDQNNKVILKSVDRKLYFSEETEKLVSILKEFSVDELAKLMKISDKLAILNYDRYRNFYDHNISEYTAIFAFKGEAYKGLSALDFSDEDLIYAQKVLRILSGLYGVLSPLDTIKEYRLEMGTKLLNSNGNDLYGFWGSKITNKIEKDIEMSCGERILINLASKEYSSSIEMDKIKYKVINVSFLENKDGKYKIVGMYAKKARGMMARYVIKNRVETIEGIKEFDKEGYTYNDYLSDSNNIIFTR